MKLTTQPTPKSFVMSNQPSFKGPLDGAITSALMTIDTNPMVNATLVDTFAMVLPRTYVDTKKRNKYAGAETFFREATGTVIVCLSSGFVAKGIAAIYNKIVDKNTNISSNLWVTNDSFDLLKHSWQKSDNTKEYVKNVLTNLSGLDGKNTANWNNIDWKNVSWFNNASWNKINWKNPKFKNIHNRLKNEEQIIKTVSELIDDKTADKADVKKVFEIVEHRIANAFGVSSSVDVKLGDKSLGTNLKNLIRDTYDMGKEIFTNKSINLKSAEAKLKSMNKVKTLGSIGLVATLGLLDQYINRQITKKRLGKDDFVGTLKLDEKESQKTEKIVKGKGEKMKLGVYKFLASAGIFTLAMAVMKIKNPSQFVKKLEFTDVVTSGNAIKTIYTALLMGRFLASRDKNELRESVTRDYLGFLNWLVVGGFVSKGVGQLFFDRKLTSLFNVNGEGKGIRHWLNNVSAKSHVEVAAKGAKFAKKNIWKINVMHTAGLLYSGLALGFALPLLNIFLTNRKEGKQNEHKYHLYSEINFAAKNKTPNVFQKFGR